MLVKARDKVASTYLSKILNHRVTSVFQSMTSSFTSNDSSEREKIKTASEKFRDEAEKLRDKFRKALEDCRSKHPDFNIDDWDFDSPFLAIEGLAKITILRFASFLTALSLNKAEHRVQFSRGSYEPVAERAC